MNPEHGHIRELIESYRPGQDDLNSPEFRELADRMESDDRLREQFRRSQQVDEAISTAMRDVPMPAGLADRLLERLDQEDSPPVVATAGTALRRRTWLPRAAAAAGLVGVAAAACAVFFLLPTDDWTPQRLAEQAFIWTQPQNLPAENWQQLNADVRKRFPPRRPRLAQVAPYRWQPIDGADAVCYQLRTIDQGGAAYLIVVPDSGRGRFPVTPDLVMTTAGRCVAVWTSGGNLYALVIEGSARRYRQLMPSSPTA